MIDCSIGHREHVYYGIVHARKKLPEATDFLYIVCLEVSPSQLVRHGIAQHLHPACATPAGVEEHCVKV